MAHLVMQAADDMAFCSDALEGEAAINAGYAAFLKVMVRLWYSRHREFQYIQHWQRRRHGLYSCGFVLRVALKKTEAVDYIPYNG